MKKSLIGMVLGIAALSSTGALAEAVEWGDTSNGETSYMMMMQSGKAFSSGIDVSTLEKVIKDSSSQIDELKELKEQLDKSAQQNSEYSRSLSQQSDKISSLESKISSLENEISTRERQTSSLESKISSLESTISALESKIK
ncbi:hypothetical protein [Chimaeribacter arupi]|uniref:hypothetical protein n=1 Tax=Chimaeribacter arupi TaxID=2060066 RepID=UPI000C7A6407|nr:hypothetical protein [Chimaeribacter arupi]PLR54645.1 hypothetical protein CYR52_01405 [Chimaeribacter arupi]